MLIHVLAALDAPARARLLHLLGLPRTEKPERELAWLRDEMRQRDSIAHARQVAHALAGAALHEFDAAFAGAADGRDKRFIRSLPYWVLERA